MPIPRCEELPSGKSTQHLKSPTRVFLRTELVGFGVTAKNQPYRVLHPPGQESAWNPECTIKKSTGRAAGKSEGKADLCISAWWSACWERVPGIAVSVCDFRCTNQQQKAHTKNTEAYTFK